MAIHRQQTVPGNRNREDKTYSSMQEMQAFALETIMDGSFILDQQWTLVDVSPSAQEKIFKLPAEDLLGKNIWLEFPEFTHSIFEQKIRQTVVQGTFSHFEAHLTKWRKWYEVFAFPTEAQIVVYLRDITGHKNYEHEVHRQKALLNAIFDTDPSGLAVLVEPDFRIIYANQTFQELLSHPELDPIGKTILELIPSGVEGLDIEQLNQLLQDQDHVFLPKFSENQTSDGTRSFSAHLQKMLWEDQTAILIVIWEITAQEQSVQTIRQSEQRNQEMNEMLTLLNDAATELLAGADPITRLDLFFERASKALGLEVFVQYNVSPDGTHLELGKLSGFPERYHKVLQRLEFGQAVCGTVAKTRKPMAVSHVQQAHDRTTRLIRKLGIDTYACHPLIVDDRLIGTLSFGSRTRPEFDPETIRILKTFCDLVAVAIDRKRTEEALRLNEERLRSIMESSLDVAYRRNLQADCYDYMSPVAPQVLGYSQEEMNGLPIQIVLELIHPEDRASVEAGMLKALETGKERLVYRFKRKDGVYRWLADYVTIQRDDQGTPLYRSGILRDIHERKEAEEALSLSEERFRLAAEAMNEGLWELNLQTNQAWWNEAYDTLFGPRPIQLPDDPSDWWLDHVYEDDRPVAKRSFWEAIEGSSNRWECEYRFLRPDGELAYVLDRAVIARDQTGKPIRVTGAMLDLTVLKQAEHEREKLLHELETERSLWRATVGSMIDAVTICDAEGHANYMNEAYTRLVEKTIQPGLALEDHSEHYQIYHPDGRLFEPTELPLQRAALTGEEQREIEVIQKSASGEDLFLRWNASPIRDEKGQVIGAVAVGRDITHQRQIEIALRESEEKFRLIADTMPSLVWTTQRDGTVEYVNEFGRKYFGLDRDDIDPYAISSHLHKDDRREAIQAWQRAIEKGEPVEIEFRLKRVDGEHRWFLSRGLPIRDTQNEIVKWYGTATDIQDLKMAQEELERRVQVRTQELRVANEELRLSAGRSLALSEISRQMSLAGVDYQRVIEAVVKTTSMLIGDGCILRLLSDDGQWLNPVAFFHRNPEALAIMSQVLKPNLHHPDDGIQGKVFRTGKGQLLTVKHQEDWVNLSDIEYLPYVQKYGSSSTMIVPLRMQDKVVGTLGVARDLPGKIYTQEDQILLQELADRAALAIFNSMLYRDLEKSLLQEKLMRQQLIQSEKYAALARLVASVAHELNNPIQTIQNCIYLLRNEITSSSAEEFMVMAIDETRRIAHLTEQLRETYRPSKDTTFSRFNLIDVVKSVHSLLETHFQHNQVSWEFMPSPESTLVNGIPDQLKQVFINICINAVDAMGPAGGRLEVEVRRYPERKQVCVSFQDTGPGIASENLKRLFEPFFTTKPKGTGLGLAISREIVEGHGGEISVDSKAGEGALFRIWLPLAESIDR